MCVLKPEIKWFLSSQALNEAFNFHIFSSTVKNKISTEVAVVFFFFSSNGPVRNSGFATSSDRFPVFNGSGVYPTLGVGIFSK